uniref:C2H2-type domain-containing protein n=1 Tax=Oryzias sinensis TaxID=183150 RepID=A0A8C8E1D7_9TELE
DVSECSGARSLWPSQKALPESKVSSRALKMEMVSRILGVDRSAPPMSFYCAGSIREEDGVRWHGCPYCSKEFKKPSDLVRHIRIHTHEKPFKCKQCFRAFAVKSTLTAHMKTHTGIKAFECQCCLKCFSTSGSMKVHMRDLRPYMCPYCQKTFKSSPNCRKHMKTHSVTGGSADRPNTSARRR